VTEAAAPTVVPRRDWYDRVLAALPLTTAFVWLVLLYAWQSWGHVTPWLFGDELQNADIQRAIAAGHRPAVLGQAHALETIYNAALAPVWWIHSTHTAYTVLKYVNSLVMTSVLFPTYALARLVVGKPAALFAGVTAAAIPVLVYTSLVLEEPAAYPYAALCFFLIVKALTVRSRRWIGGAVVASLLAPLVRGELAMIPALFALAAVFLWWTTPRAAAWRARWSTWDWADAAVLGVGVLIVFNAAVAGHSHQWLIATGYFRGRMLKNGLWAAGALTIGLGVFPVVAALTTLFGRQRNQAERAFTAVFAAALIAFGWYTAIKAAYISVVFSTLVEERNLIYVAPLLLVATAMWVERPRVRVPALAAAAGFALYLIVSTPYKMELHFYADAPGLGVLQAANRKLSWTPQIAQHVLVGMLLASVCLLLLPRLVRWRPQAVQALAASAAVLVLAWNVTAEVASASASNSFSNDFTVHIQPPLDWLDKADGGRPVLYLGQSITDPNGLWILRFWNRSIKHVWSLDGSAPAPTLSPDLKQADGRLFPSPTDVEYVLEEPGVDVVGSVVARHEHTDATQVKTWTLVRFAPPLRLAHSVLGIQSDGWIVSPDGRAPAFSAYNQFVTPGGRPGTLFVTVSRAGWGGEGKADIPGHVRIEVGTLVKRDKQPALGRVTAVRTWVVHSHDVRTFRIPTPKPPFRVEVTVSPTFVIAELDPRSSDRRHLGAQVGYAFGS
jgi:hypothetical protein